MTQSIYSFFPFIYNVGNRSKISDRGRIGTSYLNNLVKWPSQFFLVQDVAISNIMDTRIKKGIYIYTQKQSGNAIKHRPPSPI